MFVPRFLFPDFQIQLFDHHMTIKGYAAYYLARVENVLEELEETD